MPQEKIIFRNHELSRDAITINIEKAQAPVPGTNIHIPQNNWDEKDYTPQEGLLKFKISPSSGAGGIFVHKIETKHEYEVKDNANHLILQFKNIWDSGSSHGYTTTNVEVGVNDTQPSKPPKQKKNKTEKD